MEGPAGVGKTELARSVATWLELPLIRMQCYEGLDEAKALYEWKYGKQLLYTQILKDKIGSVIGDADGLVAALNKLHDFGDIFFSEQFLEPRPLLRALQQPGGAVLLVDEVDKSDQEFEAFLLEILSDYQVTIPEIGTVVRGDAADRAADLEQHARSGRCAEAALPAPAYRLPGREAGGADHCVARAGHRGEAAAAVGQLRAAVADAGSEEGAIGQRDDRLGAGAGAAARRRAGGGPGARHAERAAEVRSGHRDRRQAACHADAQGPAECRSVGCLSGALSRQRSSASEPLRRFLQVARGAGLRVSAAEGIDAARAVDVVGFGDRAVLKDTLGLVLAKTPDEKGLFDECFELYFKRDEFAASDATEPPAPPEPMSARDPTVSGDGGRRPGRRRSRSGQMLLDDDRAALAAAMEQAAREAGLENIRFFTQKNLYARRILDRMGLRALEREIEALRQSGTDEAIVRAGRLEGADRGAARRGCATLSSGTWCCSRAARRSGFARNC